MNTLKDKPRIALIGLVNMEDGRGDSNHFRLLSKYLSSTFDVVTISLATKHKKDIYSLSYPENSFYRQLYWNFKITLLVIFLRIFRDTRIIYMRTMGAVVLPLIAGKLIGVKVGVEVNGVIAEGYSKSRFLHKVLINIYQLILRRLDFINASRGYANYIIDKFGVNKKKVTFLNLGYTKLGYLHDRSDSLRHLELEHGKQRLLFIGNITEYQGIQYILNTLKDYRELFLAYNVEVLIVGDGPFLGSLKKIVEENNLSDLARFRPWVNKDAIRRYLSIGAVGLSPFDFRRGEEKSISGLKTYDYLFHKMPIISSIMDDATDFIEERELGWIIRKYDSNSIKDIILEAIQVNGSEVMVKRYNENYSFIEHNFSWENRFSKISDKINEFVLK